MSELLIPDQRGLWDRKHGKDDHAEFRDKPCDFAVSFESMLEPGSVIHEIACGVGGDAVYFAQQGHTVIGTELSGVVLNQNKELLKHPNLLFVQSDISEGLPIGDEACDAVFANLALHYFDDDTTHRIFRDIARTLKPNGLLAFCCKSIGDPGFGEGTELESNFYISDKGHVRHFFSPGYVHDLTDGQFVMSRIQEVAETKYKEPVTFLYCEGRRIGSNEQPDLQV